MENNLKTAEGVLNNSYPGIGIETDVDLIINIMKAYAIQALEAYRRACIDKHNTSGGNDFEVANIDIDQFIK